MTRMKRKAEAVPAARDQAEAIAWVGRLGTIQRERDLIEAALAETIAVATQQAEAEALALTAEAERLHRGVQLWAEANRATLTDDGKHKTVTLATGVICWRKPPPRVKLSDVKAVLEELRERNLTQFIRTKQEVNKEAMLEAPGIAALVPGVSIGSGAEQFVIEPAAPPVIGGAA